jgi:outer membrane protein assembly factor BamB
MMFCYRRTLLIVILCLVGTVFAGCGDLLLRRQQAWDNLFRDNSEADLAHVVAALPPPGAETGAPNKLGRSLMAAVRLGTPPHLVVYDVDQQKALWDRELAAIGSRPQILEELVVCVADGRVMAFDVATGVDRWAYQLPDGWTYRGAAVDEGRVYLAAGKGRLGSTQRRQGLVVALGAAQGNRLWRHRVPFLLASPAAAGGMVFVPWDGQNVTALRGEDGVEIARLRTLDDVIHFATARPEGLFYGAGGLYRLTPASVAGRREQAVFYDPPLKEVPGAPEFELNGYELPALSNRKIRFYWRAEPSQEQDGAITFTDNKLYWLYFRFVFAFDATTGELAWTFRFPEDVEAAQVVPGGLYLIGRHGSLSFVGASSGGVEWNRDLELPLRSASLSLAAQAPTPRESATPGTVRQGLQEVIFDPDNRLLPVRNFALRQLTEIDDPAVTEDLLEIISRKEIPEPLRLAAAEALRGRRTGASYLLDALAVHYDYLTLSAPAPLDVVAQSLTQMGAREALPALVAHLQDHETPISYLPALATAIVQLGQGAALGPLRDFLVRYHRDSAFAQQPETLNVIAEGLLRQGHVEEQELVQALAANRHTPAGLREHVATVLAQMEAEAAPVVAEEPQEPQEREPTAEEICQQEKQELYHLPHARIQDVMRAEANGFRDCFMEEMERSPETGQVRLVWLITTDGQGINWDISPRSSELAVCLLPRLEQIRFPCIRAYRQRARFGVNLVRPQSEVPMPAAEPAPTAEPVPAAEVPQPTWSDGPATAPPAGEAPAEVELYPEEIPDQYPDQLPD